MRLLIHDFAAHPFPLQLSRELALQGHQVLHACATHPHAPLPNLAKLPSDAPTLILRQFPLLPPGTPPPLTFLPRRRLELAHGRRIAHLISTWRPDGVISTNTPTEPQGTILKAARALRAPFLFWLQHFPSLAVAREVQAHLPLLGDFIGKTYLRRESRQLRASHRVVAPSHDFIPLLSQDFNVPESRIAIIPNVTPVDQFPETPKDNPWSRRHRLAHHFVYLYAGSLSLPQHPHLLLELAEHCRADDAVRIVVLSQGPGAQWLAAQQHARQLPNLLLLPYQNFEQMPQVLATSDVLLTLLDDNATALPSPNKILTYLCAARPLLLAGPTDNLAARLLRHEDLGLTVPPADTPAFLAAAQRLRRDPSLAASCARRARHRAELHGTIEPTAAAFLHLFPPAF